MTASELEQKGIIELREMIRTDKANNPRNLSGWLISTMDRAECADYLLNGTLPSADKTPGRKMSIESGAVKFFGKGGDPVGGMSSAEVQGKVERQAEREREEQPKAAPMPAAPQATVAPGLDALLGALTAAVKAEVLASLPPAPKQELDAEAVRKITDERISKVVETVTDTASKLVNAAVENVNAKAGDAVTQALADVMRALSTADKPAKARASAALKKATGKGANVILDRLLSLCPIGDNPANHVLIVGPSGTGKTYQARNFAAMHDWTCAPVGFHKYLEPHHISGSAAPNDDGAFSFVSGAFRDAFIAASEGKTACILLDEILRASAEMQESLLTILDPIPTTKGLVYRYRSGKPVKIGENGSAQWSQEVIECPVEKLTIVATANIGSNYGVFSVDEAFWKRFRVVRVERNGEDERQIIADACAHLDAGAVRACIAMLDESRRSVKAGALQYPACIRTLTRCASQAANKAQLKESLRLLVTEELTGWTEDGAILGTHLESAKAIFAKVEKELAKDS